MTNNKLGNPVFEKIHNSIIYNFENYNALQEEICVEVSYNLGLEIRLEINTNVRYNINDKINSLFISRTDYNL